MLGMIRSLWQFRGFVVDSIFNELKIKFSRSKLGGLWMIISPLSQVAIYALILSNVLAAKIPGIDNEYSYAIYLLAGMLAWNLYSEIINRCVVLFIQNAELLKKMHFPRITLPVIVVGSSLLNNVLLFMAMLLIFFLLGSHFSFAMLWLIPLTVLTAMLALGIGLFVGIVNVFVRDIGQAIPIVMQIWFWFTPIVYPEAIIPNKYQGIMDLNPMFHIVSAYHEIILYNEIPQLDQIIVVSILTMLVLVFSLVLFRRAGAEMVDVL